MQKINRRYQIKFTVGKRIGFVKQNYDYIVIVEYPLTTRFEVSRNIYSQVNNANVQLLNLNQNTQAKLYKDRYDFNKYIDMEIYAGYGNFLPLIFMGEVKQCYSYKDGGSTDFITDIEAWDAGFAIQTGYTSATFDRDTTSDSIIQSILASDLPSVKRGVIAPLPDNRTQRSSSQLGNTWDLITRLSSNNAFIDNNTMHILKDNQAIEGDFFLINADSGLLGSPKRSDTILNIDVIFEPQTKVGQLTRLESRTLKYLNQDYKVIGFKHAAVIGEGESGSAKTSIDLFLGTQVFEMLTPSSITQAKVTGDFLKPVSDPITSQFGYRIHPVYGDTRMHKGIDFGSIMDTPVKASNGGLVVTANFIGGYGNTVIIDHGTLNGSKMSSLYAHLDKINVKIGDKVSQSQIIALSGKTGTATAPNLHFEIRQGGQAVDPLKYLK